MTNIMFFNIRKLKKIYNNKTIRNKIKKRDYVMKKKLLSLLFIPALLLTSCKGVKINEEKAKELANKISANKDAFDGKGTEINISMKDKEDSVTYQVIGDKNENIKFKAKGNSEGKKLDFVIYCVKNEEHEEISYIKDYNEATQTYVEHVYSKKETPEYSNLVSQYTLQALFSLLLVAYFADPVKVMENDEYKDGEFTDDGVTYKNTVEYYSSGEENLTIEVDRKYVSGQPVTDESEAEEDNEYKQEMKTSITYDNLIIKSVNITNKDTRAYIKGSVAINNSLKVELPANWQDLLNK